MTHEEYMRAALDEARAAVGHGDVPVGCVVVNAAGEIIGRGRNRREQGRDATAHAEVEAIRAACAATGHWRLHGCTLYVTLEPCPMCAGAIINARISNVWYGAADEKAGACDSVLNLFEERFNHRPALRAGLLGRECADLLRAFFLGLRKT